MTPPPTGKGIIVNQTQQGQTAEQEGTATSRNHFFQANRVTTESSDEL